jgi:hypothetical protein
VASIAALPDRPNEIKVDASESRAAALEMRLPLSPHVTTPPHVTAIM